MVKVAVGCKIDFCLVQIRRIGCKVRFLIVECIFQINSKYLLTVLRVVLLLLLGCGTACTGREGFAFM